LIDKLLADGSLGALILTECLLDADRVIEDCQLRIEITQAGQEARL
jgi:hypothetical protein